MEVELGGAADPERLVAVVDPVQVHLEDAAGFEDPGDLVAEQELLDLPGDGLLGGEEGDLGQLLGDGAGALKLGVMDHVVDPGRDDPGQVGRAGVLVEVAVLDRHGGLHQQRAHLLQGHVDVVDSRLVEDREQGPVTGEQFAVLGRPQLGQAGHAGQAHLERRQHDHPRPDPGAAHQHRQQPGGGGVAQPAVTLPETRLGASPKLAAPALADAGGCTLSRGDGDFLHQLTNFGLGSSDQRLCQAPQLAPPGELGSRSGYGLVARASRPCKYASGRG